MYYCLTCEEYHEDTTAEKIFETGFRTDLIKKEKVHVGICDKARVLLTTELNRQKEV